MKKNEKTKHKPKTPHKHRQNHKMPKMRQTMSAHRNKTIPQIHMHNMRRRHHNMEVKHNETKNKRIPKTNIPKTHIPNNTRMPLHTSTTSTTQS